MNLLLPIIGGVLIGLASTLMLAGPGRITGVSGILGSILGKPAPQHQWRYFFLSGLLVGGLVMLLLAPERMQLATQFSALKLIIAGLLVGFGTRLGSGCTSGHGVCGIPRLSLRSIVATLVFMALGMLTVGVLA